MILNHLDPPLKDDFFTTLDFAQIFLSSGYRDFFLHLFFHFLVFNYQRQLFVVAFFEIPPRTQWAPPYCTMSTQSQFTQRHQQSVSSKNILLDSWPNNKTFILSFVSSGHSNSPFSILLGLRAEGRSSKCRAIPFSHGKSFEKMLHHLAARHRHGRLCFSFGLSGRNAEQLSA